MVDTNKTGQDLEGKDSQPGTKHGSRGTQDIRIKAGLVSIGHE